MTAEHRTRPSPRIGNRLIGLGLAVIALAVYVLIALRTHYGSL
jgi:hypothetical protein